MNKTKSSQRKKDIVVTAVIIIFLSAVAAMQIFPFFLQFISSVQDMNKFVPEAGKIYLWPEYGFHFENYIEAIERVELLDGVINSVIVASGFSLLSAVVICEISREDSAFTRLSVCFASRQI